MNLDSIVALALFAFVSSITPGPNNLMILASGLNFGFVRSIPHLLGISLGFGVMVLGVCSGLHTVFTQYPWAYQTVRILGTCYLLWMAWQLAHSSPLNDDTPSSSKPMGFLGAAAFQWVNPKAWVMAITSAATFLPTQTQAIHIVYLALVFIAVNLPCVALWASFGSGLRRLLQNPRRLRVFNGCMAAGLVASLYPMLRN